MHFPTKKYESKLTIVITPYEMYFWNVYTTVITLVKDLLQASNSWVRPCCNDWNGLEFDETSILDNQIFKEYKLMISPLTYTLYIEINGT